MSAPTDHALGGDLFAQDIGVPAVALEELLVAIYSSYVSTPPTAAETVRTARARAGFSQSELARRSGVPQPHISLIEAGKVEPTEQTVARLLDSARVRPSRLLDQNRQAVLELAKSRGASNVRVFGSLARGDDRIDSDIDLLMDFKPGVDIFDIAGLQAELETLLGVKVDIVGDSKRSPNRVLEAARREAVPL